MKQRFSMVGRALSGLVPIGAVAMVGYLVLTKGSSLPAAFAAVPPWVLGGAIAAHLLTLALRTEAWRTVLGAAGGGRLEPRTVHAANAGAFLVGTLQGQAAMPTRIALLRRFGGGEAPAASQIALGDAPIVLFEACASAVLAAFGSTAVGVIPGWAPWAMLAGALSILVALRLTYRRFSHRRIAARLGVGTGPAAMVAALGSTNLVTATAAGMVVSAATVLSVLIYAGAIWAWRSAAGRVAQPASVPL